MEPIQLLEKELQTLERDLEKSQQMFVDRIIGQETHLNHRRNIDPLIKKYKIAIHNLKALTNE